MFFFGFFTSYVPYMIIGLLYIGSLSVMVMPKFIKDIDDEKQLVYVQQSTHIIKAYHFENHTHYSAGLSCSGSDKLCMESRRVPSLINSRPVAFLKTPPSEMGFSWKYSNLPPPLSI